MLKRLGTLGVIVAVVALGVGLVGPAAGSGGDGRNGHHRTIKVLSINTEEDLVDVGMPDFSLGDEFVFASKLMRGGKQVGHTGVVCTITSVAREESQCVGTAWFRKGQITIQGLVTEEPEVFALPITGGSGAFKGAEGQLVVRQVSDTEELLIFRLND